MHGRFSRGGIALRRVLMAFPVAALILAAHTSLGLGAEKVPAPPSVVVSEKLSAILERWERAVRDLTCLEADVVVWDYDGVFDTTFRSQGVLYYEKPDLVHFRIGPDGRGDSGSEEWTWNERGVICRSGAPPEVTLRLSREELAALLEGSEARGRSFSQSIVNCILGGIHSPRMMLPALVEKDAEFRRRFDWRLAEEAQPSRLIGRPKDSGDECGFSEIHVIIDADTGLPRAIQAVYSPLRRQRSILLHNIRLNRPPENRDALLHPDIENDPSCQNAKR